MSTSRKNETVLIPVSAIEFREGGNTLWIHGPDGGTVLRLKTLDGVITSTRCATLAGSEDEGVDISDYEVSP